MREGAAEAESARGVAGEIRRLSNHGADRQYIHAKVGGNFRLDALQAAVLGVKQRHLAAWSDARRRNADRYRGLFSEYGLDARLDVPVESPGARHIYNQFVIGVDHRDRVREHLFNQQIGTAVYYPVPFHQQACFAGTARAAGPFPVAERAAARSLALPIYGELTEAQQRHVVASLAAFGSGTR